MLKAPPDIHQYSDFRLFLRDFDASKRRENPTWSFKVWARILGIRSGSTLSMVIKGERYPGPRLVESLCRFFNFSEMDAELFRELVWFNRSGKSPLDSSNLKKKFRKRRKSALHVGTALTRIVAQWHFGAIRELLALKDFREDPRWIAARLENRISPLEAREAIRVLLEAGFLERDSKGQIRAPVEDVHFQAEPHTLQELRQARLHIHKQLLDMAAQKLESQNEKNLVFEGVTLAIRADRLPEARKLIQEFQERLVNLFPKEDRDEVYHLQMAFFPMTSKVTC